jgi:membrane protein
VRPLKPVMSTASRSARPSLWKLAFYSLVSLVVSRRRPRDRARHRPPKAREHHGASSGVFAGTRSTDEPRQVQRQRADEHGRGRKAVSPWQIPWAGWKDIFWRTYAEIQEDRLVAVAAGVVFYALLAIFPAITAIVSLYGLFTDAATINDHLSLAAGFLPQGALDIIQEQVIRITSKGDAKLGLAFIFGLGLALWSANAGMKALIDALNVVYDETEKRGFIKLNLISLTLTLAAILSLLLAIAAVVVLPLLLGFIGLDSLGQLLLRILRWPALFLLVILGLAVLYRFGPSRTKAEWQWLSVGSVFAAIAWLITSALLSWYLGNFANYDATYGSLGAGIGLMMWLWISSLVILLGAELNSEIEHQTARDSTVGAEKPLGARGATMADTVGAAAD